MMGGGIKLLDLEVVSMGMGYTVGFVSSTWGSGRAGAWVP